MPRGMRMGGGWLFDPTDPVSPLSRDPTHGMVAPYRHRACGHIFDMTRAERIVRAPSYDLLRCPSCGAQTNNVTECERL